MVSDLVGPAHQPPHEVFEIWMTVHDRLTDAFVGAARDAGHHGDVGLGEVAELGTADDLRRGVELVAQGRRFCKSSRRTPVQPTSTVESTDRACGRADDRPVGDSRGHR
ncbi:hypothetical protein Acsp04_67010 [Actinomadura sp. NBRC 104425]|uniref:hypothetical protein n=1 Tax=Actinomadura sp. NBRC 104425 TaxID=3032204 RepID=UPI0024A15C47|nr:hypothetical protein [Actinomadura sp. NBRC 104425]GLZ16466.1 hypothetical protein Acsp04_67010 [Actinomadura sp. NBRC 104425]